MSLFDRLLEQHLLQPAPAPKAETSRVVDGVELVPGLKPPRLLSESRAARSNASFEARRAGWREEALAKLVPPPPPATSPLNATREVAPEPLPMPTPPRPPPARLPAVRLEGRPLVAVGSCKAINPDTGRQCALLHGHTKAHRHGSTEFRYSAAPGQKSFTRRDALDRLASSRDGSPFTTPATGE